MDGHEGSAPSIPVWKTGVYLSTLMPEKWNPVLELHQQTRVRTDKDPRKLGTVEADTSVMKDARGEIIGHDGNPLSELLNR